MSDTLFGDYPSVPARIDETYESFYGEIKNLWIHDHTNGVKGATLIQIHRCIHCARRFEMQRHPDPTNWNFLSYKSDCLHGDMILHERGLKGA